MRAWIAVASVCVLSSACYDHNHDREDDAIERAPRTSTTTSGGGEACIIAATPGGDGGLGGLLSIRTTSTPTVNGALTVSAGAPGEAGSFEQGPEPNAGLAGEDGLSELLEDAAWTFDINLITPGSVLQVGVDGEPDVLTLGGSDSAPLIAVERLELGPDTELSLSRYQTIVAQQLIIAEGARLTLRDDGSVSATIGTSEATGVDGATATIIARDIVVDGHIVASGADGDVGQNGGNGGQLQIRSETLTVGTNGSISVAGGNGGIGNDEQLCSPTE